MGFIMDKYDISYNFLNKIFTKVFSIEFYENLSNNLKAYNMSQPDRHDSYVSRNFLTCKENLKVLMDAPVEQKSRF